MCPVAYVCVSLLNAQIVGLSRTLLGSVSSCCFQPVHWPDCEFCHSLPSEVPKLPDRSWNNFASVRGSRSAQIQCTNGCMEILHPFWFQIAIQSIVECGQFRAPCIATLLIYQKTGASCAWVIEIFLSILKVKFLIPQWSQHGKWLCMPRLARGNVLAFEVA